MQNLLRVLSVVIFALSLFSGCAPTKLTNTWVDENYRGKSVSNIMVIGVTDKETTRRSYEDRFVKKLKAVGVEAVSSADVIRIPANKKLEKEVILEAVGKFKNDAVLITHLVRVDKKEVYTPPTYHGSFYGYYGHAYGLAYSPGYSTEHTFVRLETTLYDVKTEKPLWSGQSQTWNPSSEKQIINEVIEVVIKDMQRQKLLP